VKTVMPQVMALKGGRHPETIGENSGPGPVRRRRTSVQSLDVREALRAADPRRLGGYDLLGRLGEGGMGTVYLGRSRAGRLVAVKVIRPEFAVEEEFRARFRSEVNRARQVPPFCTAEVLDADPDHRTPYLVVEYVDGPSLADVVTDQGTLPAANLHSVAVGVATALAAIHGAGVIHRDLKPRNVLFALGIPKVIDFGIARALEATSLHTRTSQMVGTIAYMAPERFDTDSGRPVTPAADVFAWGAVVAYAGTGRTPFAADSPAATAARILTQPPALGDLAGPLRDLVERALAKEPTDRPTASELLDELLAADSRDPGGFSTDLVPRPELRRAAEAALQATSTAGRPIRLVRRRRSRVWAAAALTVALLLAGAATTYRARQERTTVDTATAVTATATAATRAAAPAGGPELAQEQALIDRLDRRGLWLDHGGDSGGICAFDSQLVITTKNDIDYWCLGPKDQFAGDQTIAVNATVLSANACAVIWFRDVGTSGYQLSLCPDEARLERYDDDDGETLIRRAPADAFQPGVRRRVTVTIAGQGVTVAADDRKLLDAPLTDPSLVAGQVVLGVTNHTFSGNARAAFADVEIRTVRHASPPAAGSVAPTYADVLHGRATSAAKLLSFDATALSAVVEPTILLRGRDYCAKYRVPSSAPRCGQDWTTEDSHTKITLAVRRDAVLRTTRDNDEKCLGDMIGGGTCPLPVSTVAGWLKEHPGALVSITAADGRLTRIAELYVP
jgi:predicted Ser/Thr protein kinase